MIAIREHVQPLVAYRGLPDETWNRFWDDATHGADAYRHAQPVPHGVFDGVFPDAVLQAVLDEWPERDQPCWTVHETQYEQKLVASQARHLGPTTRALLAELNGPRFVDSVTRLTGITGLVSDAYFSSAGLSDVAAGGRLDIHTDFTIGQRTGLDRRVNVLVYLNHDWTEEQGGQLELWRSRPLRREVSVVPTFNRMVVFDTTPDAMHGHPRPVVAGPHGSRKCLSVYFYTRGRPLRESLRGIHGVLFTGSDRRSWRTSASAAARLLIPPIVGAARRELAETRHRDGG
jgi:hypothetical protein